MSRSWTVFFVLFLAIGLQSCGGGGGSSSSPTGNPPADSTPPTVISTNPPNLSTAIPVNTSITANFSESVSTTTPSSAFTLTQGSSTTPGAVTFSGGTATFTPATRLGTSLPYTATLAAGIKDLAGNGMVNTYTWSFITADCIAMTLNTQFNLGTAVGVGGFKCMATDGNTIYLYCQDAQGNPGKMLLINPQNGAVLNTYTIPMVSVASTVPNAINFIADITWHGNAIWASGSYVTPAGAISQGVFKVNLTTGLSENQLPTAAGLAFEVPIFQGLASDGVNLYVAIDRNYAYPTPIEHVVVKFDPATTSRVPLAPALLKTTGQATRLTFGGGFLYVFNNPNFQKVDPVSGVVVSTYCKNDGGSNILYLNNSIWSIKDFVLWVYSIQ